MPKNLSYSEAKRHLEDDPEILKLALTVLGMLPDDERPIDINKTLDDFLERNYGQAEKMRGEYHDGD